MDAEIQITKADNLPLESKYHSLEERINGEKIDLLYVQSPYGIFAQALIAIFLSFAFRDIIPEQALVFWLIYMSLILVLSSTVIVWYKINRNKLSMLTWLTLISILIFLAGLGWGIAASLLMPPNDIIHQTVIIIIILGLTAGSLTFLSAYLFTFCLYFFPIFIPLSIWLVLQDNTYNILTICNFIYIPTIVITCYFANKFLDRTIRLSQKNINLDSVNQLLEKRVHQRTQELEKSLAITESTLEASTDAILVVNNEGFVEYFNEHCVNLLNPENRPDKSTHISALLHCLVKQILVPSNFLSAIKQLNSNPEADLSDKINLANGKVIEWFSKPHRMRKLTIGRVWIFRDITHRKRMEDQLAYQADHDILTGLSNRTGIYDRIHEGIRYAKANSTNLIILFLDLDNFKLINDNLGHHTGDLLLQKIAQLLIDETRETDTIARFGGDEFIIMFFSNDTANAEILSQKILMMISKPIQLLNHEIVVTASIGICIGPKDGEDAMTLLKNADMAMYSAKAMGKNSFKRYDASIKERNKQNLETQMELRNALASNQFFLLYQPIINLKTNKIIGAETLIRWKHPTRGIILPLDFIPIAEESNIILSMGEWVFRNACLQNKAWQNQGYEPITIAINVSGVQLLREGFLDMVELSLTDSGLSPQYVDIELTESTIMNNTTHTMQTLYHLKNLGIQLSIDDFGTGYSSLNYLRDFPVSKLKIDRVFIDRCISNENDASIIKAIIAMGHSFKIKVLAEGIETEEQLCFLKEAHCDEGQGYYYGKPMTAKMLSKWLEKK